jgi:hypothetical protein
VVEVVGSAALGSVVAVVVVVVVVVVVLGSVVVVVVVVAGSVVVVVVEPVGAVGLSVPEAGGAVTGGQPRLTAYLPALAARNAAGTQLPLMITPAGGPSTTYAAMASCAAARTSTTERQLPFITIWSAGRLTPSATEATVGTATAIMARPVAVTRDFFIVRKRFNFFLLS